MVSPYEIKQKAERRYYDYLRASLSGAEFFPLIITCDKKLNYQGSCFWSDIEKLTKGSKESRGYGYTVEWRVVETKAYGKQDVPTEISFQSEEDYLKFLGKEEEKRLFDWNCRTILSRFPELYDWIMKFPNKVVQNGNLWSQLMEVCGYFKKIPKPNMYIRGLPVKVYTKFIEENKSIIGELLDVIINEFVENEEREFEKRYHLKYKEALVRMRVLDDNLCKYLGGLSDFALPISEMKRLCLPIKNVYIVENEINMLTFPSVKESVVIWGRGWGVKSLKDVEWIGEKNIYYWGDLDVQGFEILSFLRETFVSTRSFLMDKETFDLFFQGEQGKLSNNNKELFLKEKEEEIYKYLKENNFRLEQEKIPQEYTCRNIPV